MVLDAAAGPAKVICAGLHDADILGRYVVGIPPRQGLGLIEEIRLTVAGTAAATAVDLARLGVSVDTVGAVGNDTLGNFMREQMAQEGVGVERLKVQSDYPTSASILPIRPDGSRPSLHVIGSNKAIVLDDFPDEMFAGVSVLHFGGVGLLPNLDGPDAVEVLRRAKRQGVVVTMDFIPSGDLDSDRAALVPCFPYVDDLVPSEDDAFFIAGTEDRRAAIAYYLDAGVSVVVITMGGDGVSISDSIERDRRLPAYEISLVDTTGCGDAFSAGFISGLVDGAEIFECAERGLASGSLVATGLGSDAGLTSRAVMQDFRKNTPRGEVSR